MIAHSYTRVRRLIFNLADQTQVAWIEAPIWPPAGSVIELGKPNRDALVLETRLVLAPDDDQAVILVSVREFEEGETIPRHAGDRILGE